MSNVAALFSRLRRDGFSSENVGRWYGYPILPTDARYVLAPPGRSRQGIGGWIALWVAGEAVPLAALGRAAPSEDERVALVALGLVEDDAATLVPRARLLPWRDLVIASPPAEAFDVSALNVAASLPRAATLWDVGCGAGLLALVAARAGARVFASDVDGELVEWARLNAALNGVEVEFAVGDLLAPGAGRAFDAVVFNAPLVRAPLAVAAGDEPRYSASPEGEALALRFLDGVRARERILVHTQLSPAIERALAAHAARAAVLSVVFARAPDGTPHALTEIRVGEAPSFRRVEVPLSAACPHLSRPIFDALAGPRALADDATPLPAPWLELVTRERYDGGTRRALAVTFGGVAVDDEDVALLARLSGAPLAALGLSSSARERLCVMIERGHVIVR